MKKGCASHTAQAAAAIRANHYLYAHDPVFADPYAFHMTSSAWRMLLKNKTFSSMLNSRLLNRSFGRLTGQVVARSRFCEDLLLQAAHDRKPLQYVLVGAGLDSFSCRLAPKYPHITVFEADHPDTQQLKILLLQQYGVLPDNVVFTAVDFEQERLSERLKQRQFQPEIASFFSWLGTTHYLKPSTTLEALQDIASLMCSGSELVMDYSVDFKSLRGIDRCGSMAVAQFTHLLGEPIQGAFQSKVLHQAVEAMRFSIVQDLSATEIDAAYFQHRSDQLRHTHAARLLHLKKM